MMNARTETSHDFRLRFEGKHETYSEPIRPKLCMEPWYGYMYYSQVLSNFLGGCYAAS